MDPARREQIEKLFEEALQFTADARESLLLKRCGGDAGLLNEVRALLAAHEAAGGIVDRDPRQMAEALSALLPEPSPHSERPRPPRPIGPYRILSEVGRGGMSVVYRAERSDGHFRRRVALKVLRGELDVEELHARLASERQILASLEHPNIARLLDGGLTEDGRPYLVMEYVEGTDLHTHCDEHRLSIEERLLLFVQVARAVQHAHAKLVVHRDLKASNILVTEEGEVRLLDFGIAKVLDLRRVGLEPGKAPITRTDFRLFTPEYASPEQLRGEAATVQNDVWALGVILYELLTGGRPFEVGEEGPRGLERAILESEPVRPSARVLHGPPERAHRRGAVPRVLARTISGDLDRIVAKALKKEGDLRYASVEQFADDVERFLAGHPVRARPDRLWYRASRLLKRRKLEAAAAVMVLLAILGGSGLALWQAREARMEHDRATEAARRAEAVATYLTDMFRAADPWEVPADRLSARELLHRGEVRLENLPDDPLLRARILTAMGETYMRLGDAGSARRLLEEALEIRVATSGEHDPRTTHVMRALADLLRREGRLAEAEVLAGRALRAAGGAAHEGAAGAAPRRPLRFPGRVEGGTSVPDRAGEAAALGILGFVFTAQGRTDEALEAFRSELAVLREAGLGDSPEAGHALVDIAAIHRRLARFDEAEGYLREALRHRMRTLGEDDPLTAVAMARLGGLLADHLGRPEEAAEFFAASLRIQDRVLGLDHPSRIEGLGGLAAIREESGDVEGAEALLLESVRTHLAGLGPDHPTTMAAREGFARFLARTGRPHEADSIYRMTVPLRRENGGALHPGLAGSLSGWGGVLLALGRVDEAEAALEESLAIRGAVFGPDHGLIAITLGELAAVDSARGDRDGEVARLARGLAILQAFHPPGHPEVAAFRARLDAARAR